jgi:cell division protein FtsZ
LQIGADAKPSVDNAAVRKRILDLIKDANMVFLVAGMGGGTGTDFAPIVAQIAREMKALTVAVVTKPLALEGNRNQYADEGIKALSEYVDTMIVVPNTRLMEVLGNDAAAPEIFTAANVSLHRAVAGIAEIITVNGMINIGVADARIFLSGAGMVTMGSAVSSGQDRARVATERAISSLQMESVDMAYVRRVMINITSTSLLKLKDIAMVLECVKFAAVKNQFIIIGTVADESMGEELRVTLFVMSDIAPL